MTIVMGMVVAMTMSKAMFDATDNDYTDSTCLLGLFQGFVVHLQQYVIP